MKSIYLAGPLFSSAEREFNRKLRDRLLELGFSVFLPQEDSNNVDVKNRQELIYKKNVEAIDNSDFLVAVLDGPDVDSGTAWEIGYASARGKQVIGLRTDFRTLGVEGAVNLMIEKSVNLCDNVEMLLNECSKLKMKK